MSSMPSLLELANLALDKHLVAHAEQPLGLLVGNRRKACGKARSQNDCVIDPIRFECLRALLGEMKALGLFSLQVPAFDELTHRRVYRAHRKSRALGN